MKILTSGPMWHAEWPYFTEICNLIDNAQSSLHISLYILTQDKIIQSIENAIIKGINTELFLYENDLNDQNAINKFRSMTKNYSHFHIYIIEHDHTLHTKLIIADCERFILGSANLTNKGMFNNFEVGIYLEDPAAAETLIKLLYQIKQFAT